MRGGERAVPASPFRGSGPAPSRHFHVLCPKCGVEQRNDLLEDHLAFIHLTGVRCVTCVDRRRIWDYWDNEVECPACCGVGQP